MNYLAMGSLSNNGAIYELHLMEHDLKSNKKMASSSHDVYATITAVIMSCQVSYYCSLNGLYLHKIDDFLLVHIAHSRTIKAIK